MAEAKHSFVDDYPYLVYTNENTLVYSNKADTSIDDISGGGATIGSLRVLPNFYDGTIAENADIKSSPTPSVLFALMIDTNLLISPSLGEWSQTARNVQVAEGVRIIIEDGTDNKMDGIYVITLDAQTRKMTGVKEVNCSEEFIKYDSYNCIALTMPQMADNEIMLIHYPAGE